MPGGVIEVRRRERAGPLGWLDVFSAIRFVRVSWRRARGASRGRRGPGPGRLPQRPERSLPVLVADVDGRPRCVACGLCALACPSHCITVVPGDHPDDPASRYPERFDLDLGRCIVCGLCEEACPELAIVLGPAQSWACDERSALRRDRDALLVPASALTAQLEALAGEATSGPDAFGPGPGQPS